MKPKTRTIWTKEMEDRLRELWSDPWSSPETAALQLSVTKDAVFARAAKLCLPRKAVGKPPQLQKISCGVAELLLPGCGGGHSTVIDESDLPWFMAYKSGWMAHNEHGRLYVYTRESPPRKLHRLLLNAPVSALIDHINGNGLDNRRTNLRLATAAQNTHNSGPRRHARSQYKGVWQHVSGLFGGAVKAPHGKRVSIGYYRSERDAARAHDAVVRLLRGEYAWLNLPDDSMTTEEILAIPSLARIYQNFRDAEIAA